MYIARSVSIGMVLKTDYAVIKAPRMPLLTGQALQLYIKVHGRARYELYNNKDLSATRHGGLPPNKEAHEITDLPQFTHRPEHDVESNFLTLLSVLLRLQPLSAPRDKSASPAFAEKWRTLRSHTIPNEPSVLDETRHSLFIMAQEEWTGLFLPEMRDVALMMWEISRQVAPEYALFEGHLEVDHLHEAVQRIILQYLVSHRDRPIPVDPVHLRPTEKGKIEKSEIDPFSGGTTGLTQTESSRASANIKGSQRAGGRTRGTRGSARKGSSAQAGPSRGSAHRRSAQARPANREVDEGPKRRSESQSGRGSKRRKGPSGSAVSTQGDD